MKISLEEYMSDIYFWKQLAITLCISNASHRTFQIIERCVKVKTLGCLAKDDKTLLNLLNLRSREIFTTTTVQFDICLNPSRPLG